MGWEKYFPGLYMDKISIQSFSTLLWGIRSVYRRKSLFKVIVNLKKCCFEFM
jgi:hypothetical protein